MWNLRWRAEKSVRKRLISYIFLVTRKANHCGDLPIAVNQDWFIAGGARNISLAVVCNKNGVNAFEGKHRLSLLQ